MRLSFHVQGNEVVNTLEAGTISYKRAVTLQSERIRELSSELMDVLERGNRAHTLSSSNLRRMREVGEQLTLLLTHPEILERLPAGEEVFLQLDESLVTVPWELLHDGEDFWCHRFDLGRAVATPQAMIGRSAPMPSSLSLRMLVICSDPRGDLPHALAEGEALLERLDSSKVVDTNLLADPSVEIVRRQLKEYDVLHFAGHADHDQEHPERSGWLLKDGKLTAADVMSLSGGRAMPMLVFSNACHSSQTSAWKSGRKVYGLANAFLLAGVRLYVGTQWEVVDGQSAELAIAFYEALGRGAGAGMAMRVARKKIVREQGEGALAWASYVLYGDPSLAPMKPTEFRQKEVLSTSLLGVSVPPKRSVARNSDAAYAANNQPRGRGGLSGWVALISALVALAALGAVFYLLRQKPPTPRRGSAADPPRLVVGRHVAMRPLVAPLVGAEGSPLARCMRQQLEDSGRFRLVAAEAIKGLLEKPPRSRLAALSAGKTLGAEIVAYVEGQEDGKARAALVDVLTGEVPIKLALAAGPLGCKPIVAEMVRVLLGEGRVTAVTGERTTVNLGWKSRVAPGLVLLLERDGRPAGSLTVERVEMDRCTARGHARVGDIVRLPR